MAKKKRKARQMELVIPTWGGRRRGAGRKRVAERPRVSHRTRPVHVARHPVHVTIRMRAEWHRLRTKALLKRLLQVVRATNDRGLVRIVEFCFLRDHVHLVVEARDAAHLARGMQGFSIRLARALHAHFAARGSVVADRYHARALKTPLEVRNAVAYVINNGRKHGERLARGRLDPFSSGPWSPAVINATGPRALPSIRRPTADPSTWLLRIGWRKHHPPIDVDEVPSAAA